MSCNCVHIELMRIPIGTPAEFKRTDGHVELDLYPNAKFAQTKVASELNEFGTLKESAVLSLPIPSTKKNRWALKDLLQPITLQGVAPTSLHVRVRQGSGVLPQSYVRVLSDVSDIEIQLVDGIDDIRMQLKGILLKDLIFPDFTWNYADIQANQVANASYADGGNGFILYPIYFNGWLTQYQQGPAGSDPDITIVPADFRPMFSPLALLQKAFCTFGYEFRSPIFEEPIWRSRHIYILNREGFTYPDPGESRYNVRAESTLAHSATDTTTTRPFPWNVETHDPGFNFTDAINVWGLEYAQLEPANYISRVTTTVENTLNNSGTAVSFELLFRDFTAGAVLYRRGYTIDAGATETITAFTDEFTASRFPSARYNWSVENVSAAGGGRVTIEMTNSSVRFDAVEGRIYSGDTINPAILIDPEYTALDLLAGMLHFIGLGKVVRDRGSQQFTVYHERRVDNPYYVNVESFIKVDQPRDWDSKIVCESDRLTWPNRELGKRYHRVGFAKTTDQYIKDEGFNDDNPLYSKTFDLGAGQGYIEDTEDYFNPFFEPTLNRFAVEVEAGASAVSMPIMSDNDDGQISFDIQPRILDNTGVVQQVFEQLGASVTYRGFSVELFDETFSVYAYQFPEIAVSPTNTVPDQYLIYGDADLDMSEFWQPVIEAEQLLPSIEVLVFLTSCEFRTEDFRRPIVATIKGHPLKMLLRVIKDFQVCRLSLSTPIELSVLKDEPKPC